MNDDLRTVHLNVIGGRAYGKTTYLSYAFNVYNKTIELKEGHRVLRRRERSLDFIIDPDLDSNSLEYKRTEAVFRKALGRQESDGPDRTDTLKTSDFSDMSVVVRYDGVPLFKLVLHDYAGGFGMGENELEVEAMAANMRHSRYHMAFFPCPAFTNKPGPWANDLTDRDVESSNANARIIGRLYRAALSGSGYFFVNMTCSDMIYPMEKQIVVNNVLTNLLVNPHPREGEDVIALSRYVPIEMNFTACPDPRSGAEVDIDQPLILLLACIMRDIVSEAKGRILLPKTDRTIVRALDALEKDLKENYSFETRRLYYRYMAARIPQIDID